MKRRAFVLLSVTGASAMIIPTVNCRSRNPWNKALAQPQYLSHILDDKTLTEIGMAYRQQVPAESKEDQLVKLLLTDTKGKMTSDFTDNSTLDSALGQKIHEEFETGMTVIVNGWILSTTEARQCALFSISH